MKPDDALSQNLVFSKCTKSSHSKQTTSGDGKSVLRGCKGTVVTARAATLHNTFLYRENSISALTPGLLVTFVIPQQSKQVHILGHTR